LRTRRLAGIADEVAALSGATEHDSSKRRTTQPARLRRQAPWRERSQHRGGPSLSQRDNVAMTPVEPRIDRSVLATAAVVRPAEWCTPRRPGNHAGDDTRAALRATAAAQAAGD
jgi:hypothetical protein